MLATAGYDLPLSPRPFVVADERPVMTPPRHICWHLGPTSMSVVDPGVFAPPEDHGKILLDGAMCGGLLEVYQLVSRGH